MQRRNALDGALVADAATMGLHWLYDQAHIELVERSGDILFRQPDKAVFKGKPGYFAHATRRAGELSHYGESVRIVGQLIADGQYSVTSHQQSFFSSFGPCGAFVGYADRPTKALIARMITEGDDISINSGMDDDQMPGFCVVPGLFSGNSGIDMVSSAVQVISNNADVVAGSEAVYRCLEFVLDGVSLPDALTQAADSIKGPIGELLQQALDLEGYQPLQAAQQFGMDCHVNHAFPVIWHLLKHASDFESTVRDNIRCGGDNCGRSVVVGAIAGLAFGVPESMISCMKQGRIPIDG